MMYVGHFSFSGDGGAPWHAFFTCVVDAADVDAAVGKFKRLIRDVARRGDVFGGVSEIYMDSCIELRSLPKGGLMTYVTIRDGEDTGGISAALLGATSRSAVAYSWSPDPAEESTEPRPIEPFVRLRAKRSKAKAAGTDLHEKLLQPTGGSHKVH
jgi:hypothetical protein